MARRLRWVVGTAAVAALAVGMMTSALRARPGTVTDGNGTKYNGDVTPSPDGKYVIVKGVGGIETKIHVENARVEYTDNLDDQYAKQHAKLAADDAKRRVELGRWANDHGRADLAIKALEEAVKIEPTNRQASLDLDTARKQLDLDKSGAKAATKPAAATAPAESRPDARRMLNNDEINLIRQHELSADDSKARVKFDNNVARRYVASGAMTAPEFDKLTPAGQALAVLAGRDPGMAKDVRVLTDPAPVVEFKTKVMPIIARGCGSPACHGGNNAGSFALYAGETPAATYSNFYVLQTYRLAVGGVQYNLLDRVTPERSLALQFGLPMVDANPPHPKVPDYRPRFKSRTDPAYTEVSGWLTSFRPIAPEYGINVSPVLVTAPATQPGMPPTTAPAATRPAGK